MSSIYEPYGDLVDSNRGIVEFSEFLKRRVSDNKYLLTTAEWGTISLHSLTAQLDCMIFATDNEKNLSAFKTHPDWPSFNGRFAYVRVPYVLKWSDEQKICEKIIEEHIRNKTHVAPHTSKTLSLWSILTRIRKSKDKLASKLSYTDKVIFYDKGIAPNHWSQKDQLSLYRHLKDIVTEYDEERSRALAQGVTDASYEGRSGASFRDVENIIVDAIHKRENYLSPLTLFYTIEEIIKDDSVYEFPSLHKGNEEDSTYEEGFLDPKSILKETETYYVKLVKKDIQKSAGLVEEEEYKKLFSKYINHAKAWTRGEKVVNPLTGQREDPSETLMSKIEEKLEFPKDEIKDRRKELFNKIAAWAIDHGTSEDIPYDELFSDILEVLRKNSDTGEVIEHTKRIQEFILWFETPDWIKVPEEEREQVTQTIANMLGLGYTKNSLKEAVVFVINNDQ